MYHYTHQRNSHLMSNLLRIFALSLLILLTSKELSATGLYNVGMGPFAINHEKFDCNGFFKEIKDLKELHMAVLFNTFGNKNTCFIKLLEDTRLKSLTVHLINEPCHRNRRCGSYEFLNSISSPAAYQNLWAKMDSKLVKKFTKYVRPLQRLLNVYAGEYTSILISPGLESNIGGVAAKNLIKITRRLFPEYRILWNPLAASSPTQIVPRSGADVVEGHGSTPRLKAPCTVNLDGTDIDFPSRPVLKSSKEAKNYVESGAPLQQFIETYANRCEFVILWVNEFNCIGGVDTFIDPRRRSCKDVRKLTRLIVNEIKHANKKGRAEPLEFVWSDEDNKSFEGCTEVVKSPADGPKLGFLLKQSEFRDRGAVVLLPGRDKPKSLKIYNKGKVEDTFTFSGYYHGQPRQLWRSPLSPMSYKFKAVLKAKYSNKTVCYKLNNPRIRID